MVHSVRKAIIPTAGRGTRLRPVTEAVPKEMLPIGAVPMVHRAIAELVRGKVDQIAIVVNSSKLVIREYLQAHLQHLDCQIHYLVQEHPRGVADAILLADDFLADEPFVFFMPDEVCLCPMSPIALLGKNYDRYQQALLALTWIPPEWVKFFQGTGRIATEPLARDTLFMSEGWEKSDGFEKEGMQQPGLAGDVFRITQLKDKTHDCFSTSDRGQLKGVGIGILDGEFLELARQHQQHFDGEGEFDDVPIWQELVQRDRLLGVMTNGAIVDAGNPLGFGLANRYWLETARHFEHPCS